MKWFKNLKLKGKVRYNEPLKRHTSFKVGGPCFVWFEPRDVGDLTRCVRAARKEKIPYCVMGNGTNIVARDKGFNGIVISLAQPAFKKMHLQGNRLRAGAGTSIQAVMRYLSGRDVGGYEFLAGIPATVGGAVAMNAGATIDGIRQSIGGITAAVKVLDPQARVKCLCRKQLCFGYRTSNLKGSVVLEAIFVLRKADRRLTAERMRALRAARRKSQDYSRPNAGCVFKNPSKRRPAGFLIEASGCKGMRVGGAMVSGKHANFILNFDSARADDILKLIEQVKERVRHKFGIRLKEEIEIV